MKGTYGALFLILTALPLAFAQRMEAAANYAFPTFNVGTMTGGGAGFAKSLDVSGLPNSEYLFVRVSADYASGAAPHDGYSSTLNMELDNGGATVYWPSSPATLGAVSKDNTNTLYWCGVFPKSSYQGGSNLVVKFADTFNDANGPYYSTLSNVVVTLYPAPTPSKTFSAFNVGTMTGGGAGFAKSLDVSGLPSSEYLFVRVSADYASGAVPHDGYSSTLNMELDNGGATVYWPSSPATLGAVSKDSTNTLYWCGVYPKSSYQGGSNLVVKFADTFNDTNGPYYSTLSNVVVALYPTKGAATVTLAGLSQTYNGSARAVTATTVPNGLAVSFTYNNSPAAPANTGSYTVIGTISDAFYQGSATNTLVISPGSATVTLANLSQTYDGTAKAATATTAPSGLTVNFTYNGAPAAPANAGSYTVIGTISNANYTGSATNTLVIGKGPATVTLANLSQTYDGTAKAATARTVPSGLIVNFTYNGAPAAPANIGNYTVIGTISDANYQGSATNTLVIGAPAAPDLNVNFSGTNLILAWTNNVSGFALQFTTNLALPMSWAPVSTAPVLVNGWNRVTNSTVGATKFYRLKL